MVDIKAMITQNTELMTLLEIIDSFNLNDCWLCAGTIRNYIWDYLSTGVMPSSINETDIDVIFYDKRISYEETLEIENQIKKQYPQYQWEIKNQYLMNVHSPHTKTYTSSKDAVSKFPEKCTAIATRLDCYRQVELFTPHGIEDLIQFRISPTPHYATNKERQAVYKDRIQKKNWKAKWPQLVAII